MGTVMFKMLNVLFIFLLPVFVGANKGSVSFFGTQVTIYCTNDHVRNGTTITEANTLSEEYGVGPKMDYHCYNEMGKTLSFFIRAKVCEHCHEVDGPIVIGAFVGDLLLTAGIIIIAYVLGQRKARKSGPQNSTNMHHNPASSAPTGDGEYQPLGKYRQDVYATVHKNG